MAPGCLDVSQSPVALKRNFVGSKDSDFPGGNPRDERLGWDDLSRAHDGAGCDQRILPDLGAIEHHRADPDQGPFRYPAAVHHRAMADADLVGQEGGETTGRDMQRGLVLDIRPLANHDALDVPAQNAAVEHTRIASDLDIADHHGARRHPNRGMDPRPKLTEGAQDRALAPGAVTQDGISSLPS